MAQAMLVNHLHINSEEDVNNSNTFDIGYIDDLVFGDSSDAEEEEEDEETQNDAVFQAYKQAYRMRMKQSRASNMVSESADLQNTKKQKTQLVVEVTISPQEQFEIAFAERNLFKMRKLLEEKKVHSADNPQGLQISFNNSIILDYIINGQDYAGFRYDLLYIMRMSWFPEHDRRRILMIACANHSLRGETIFRLCEICFEPVCIFNEADVTQMMSALIQRDWRIIEYRIPKIMAKSNLIAKAFFVQHYGYYGAHFDLRNESDALKRKFLMQHGDFYDNPFKEITDATRALKRFKTQTLEKRMNHVKKIIPLITNQSVLERIFVYVCGIKNEDLIAFLIPNDLISNYFAIKILKRCKLDHLIEKYEILEPDVDDQLKIAFDSREIRKFCYLVPYADHANIKALAKTAISRNDLKMVRYLLATKVSLIDSEVSEVSLVEAEVQKVSLIDAGLIYFAYKIKNIAITAFLINNYTPPPAKTTKSGRELKKPGKKRLNEIRTKVFSKQKRSELHDMFDVYVYFLLQRIPPIAIELVHEFMGKNCFTHIKKFKLNYLVSFSSNSSRQRHIFWLNRDSFCVNCAQIGVFKKPHHICLGCFL